MHTLQFLVAKLFVRLLRVGVWYVGFGVCVCVWHICTKMG